MDKSRLNELFTKSKENIASKYIPNMTNTMMDVWMEGMEAGYNVGAENIMNVVEDLLIHMMGENNKVFVDNFMETLKKHVNI